ncbi:putative formin-like protein 3-like [Capsicum annuum]|nr:putative formin-like protein 3-like [Capsicum annuum]KAF3653489.1 putative formin-like protein 3-like [Capsicum annuum]
MEKQCGIGSSRDMLVSLSFMFIEKQNVSLEVDLTGCALGSESCRQNSILIFSVKSIFQDKFEVRNGLLEHKLQGFVIRTMQRLFKAWKSRLHVIYSSYSNDKDRLSHCPEDFEWDNWKHLVEHFGSDKFKFEEIELCMIEDKILSLVLGERSRYVRGKGYGKKPPNNNQTQQANIETSVSSAVESMHQEIQLNMERKLQEERELVSADLKRDMDQDL